MPVAARRLLLAAAMLAVLLAGLATGGRWVREWVEDRLRPAATAPANPVLVNISQGLSTAQVAEMLQSRGLIRDARVFRYYVRFLRMDSQLQGGEYELSADMSPDQIVRKIASGQVVVRTFTVPEGLTVTQIAERLAEQHLVDRERFLEVAGASSLADRYLPDRTAVPVPLEGYLFPSTYQYKPGISEAAILGLMFRGFEKVWTPEFTRRAQELQLTVHQVVTLASIIEKEARVPEERPIISGVYHNRLSIEMKLDADPTVHYALGKPAAEPLLYADLEVESPFNTYRVAGLPPGPIAAPGAAAIEAALYPEKHDYWYFVAKADGSGGHYFATTLAEQESNIARAEANQAARNK